MKTLLERNIPTPSSQTVEGITDTVERASRTTLTYPAILLDTSAHIDPTTQTYLSSLVSQESSPNCLRVYISDNGLATEQVGYLHKNRIPSWQRVISSEIYQILLSDTEPLSPEYLLALS